MRLAPSFCELGKGHTGGDTQEMRETLCPRRAPMQRCWAGGGRGFHVYWIYLAVEFCLQSSAVACAAARSCFTPVAGPHICPCQMSWGLDLLVPSSNCSGSSALARASHSPLVSLVTAAGLMRVHTVSTFTSLTKILNCPNGSQRNSAYKSLQVEYEPFKLKKQGRFSPTY